MIGLYNLATNFTPKSIEKGKWIDGEYMHELEEALKSYLGVPYVILTNSGTSALLAAYWVMRSDNPTLVTDAYTFPATYQTARLLSYKINFSRSLQQGSYVPLSQPEQGQLKTITHLFGQPNPDIDDINGPVIEDACQSFGAQRQLQKVGTIGTIGCFSFYPTKSLHSCGHGGAFVTSDEDLFDKAKIFIESGRKDGKLTQDIALNLRMDEIKAEFLIKELAEYDQKNSRQRDIARRFSTLIPGEQPYLKEQSGDRHVYSVCNMLIDNRDAFRDYMQEKGIGTMVYYDESVLPPAQREQYADITSRIVAIPCRHNLTNKDIEKIEHALKGWFS